MLPLLIMVAAASAAPPEPRAAQATHAIAAGRLDQARSMIAEAVASGAKGDTIERLLADLAFAARNNGEALRRYEALLKTNPDDSQLLERAVLAAVRSGAMAQARSLAARATAAPGASWRAWNARGVTADFEQDPADADASYARSLALAPDQPEVLNNLGWSRLLRGDWDGAVDPLERAVSLMPGSVRSANNLELARMALASGLPERRADESTDLWAMRLNDAGVAAQLRGERARAVAAFSRAIEARGSWYERAANNLAAAHGRQ